MRKTTLLMGLTVFGAAALVGVAAIKQALVLHDRARAAVSRLAEALVGAPDATNRRRAVARHQQALAQAKRENRLIERAATTPSATRLEVGACINGRYQVEWFLGRGSSGRAFRAQDRLLDRTVCLKELIETVTVCGDRLLDEARTACRVRHANVVTVFDVVPRTGGVIIVTELLPGTLEDHVTRNGPLALPAAVRVLEGALAGLAALHDQQVVHRDLKPANVFLTHDGTAKIGDFGVSTVGTKVTLAPDDLGITGTAGFLAPELLAGEPPSPASDLYSVGRVIERIVAADARHALAPVIDRALARDPQERFQTAAEMRHALRDVVSVRYG